MPEIPEIKAHSERLDLALSGSTVRQIDLLSFSALKTFSPTLEELADKQVIGVSSRGKYLVFNLSDDFAIAVHLMQGGRLRQESAIKTTKPRGALARFIFDGDLSQSWLLTEAGKERKAGIWLIHGSANSFDQLNKLGPDADAVDLETLNQILTNAKGRIHKVLRHQQTIAGIGRLLANEILHHAKLSPFKSCNKLDPLETQTLFDSMQTCIAKQLDYERTLDDIGKSENRPTNAHNKKGEHCPTCGNDKIRTVEYSGYTIAYCPTCQTKGKILADNTTSKFLK